MIPSLSSAPDRAGEPDSSDEIQVGGQAVIEGVVMRGPKRWAVAVRRPSGEMYVTVNTTSTLAQRFPRLNRFPLRGIFVLVDSLVIGIKSLSLSANISLEEPDGEGEGKEEGTKGEAEEGPEEEKKGLGFWEFAIAIVLAVVLFLGLFIVVPTVIAKSLDRYLGNTILYNLFEGGLRITIFVLYLAAMSLLPDLRRVFEYHGAEHKVVHAYEAGGPLTPEFAGRFSTAHMRCGTTFVLVVLVISVLIFSLFGRPALWLRIVERLAIIPLVASISYEIIRMAGKHEHSLVVRVIMAPGLWLQRLTTREPDQEKLEVAIDALNAAMGKQAAADGA
ncbi:MAG: DUF1385 domain-containing protein [Actinomycetia bacterium]|nr:DUF1385 domain-containing protein [Actinomycetes bacterium]